MPRGHEKIPLLIAPGGVREDLNPATIPEGELLDAENFLTRQARGRPRPGYALLGSQLASADRIMGFGFRGSMGTSTSIVIHTITAAYSRNAAGAYTAITGTWTTSDIDEHVRMVAYPSGGTLYLVRTNLVNAIDIWNGTGSFTNPVGTAPACRDITVTNGRILGFNVTTGGTNFPYRAQWNDLNDIDTWTAGNIAELDETPDEGVACRAFGPLSAGLYKEDSVWLAVAQAAATPFQFQLVAHTPGPVSPAVLVSYKGKHYWLAKDGAIYAFDGNRVEAVGTKLQTTIRDNFDWNARLQSHAWIVAQPEPELWVVYPSTGDDMTKGFSLNLTTGAMYPHEFAHHISASSEWVAQAEVAWNDLTGTWATLSATYPTWNSMGSGFHPTAVLGQTNGNVHQFGLSTSDNGTAIAWHFTHPWRALGGLGNRFYLDGVMSYWKRLTTSLTITVGVTVTNSLGDADTESTATFDVSTDSNHLVNVTGQVGQWAQIKHSASSVIADLEHRGAALLGWKRGLR